MREMTYENKSKIKYYVLLHIGIFSLAGSGICSKLAAKEVFFSFNFFMLYVVILVILSLYAILWQQVLKHIELTTAYLNKSVGIIWGIFFGNIIFNEDITANMIVGAIIVIFGVSLVVTDND